MMFYTVIAGWLLYYFVKMLRGDFVGLDTEGVAGQFGQLMPDGAARRDEHKAQAGGKCLSFLH